MRSEATSNSPIRWDHIESFVGYGREDAPVVFLGMEEGGDNERLLEDLIGRSHAERFGEIKHQNTTQRTWRLMCDLMLRRDGVASPTAQERLAYQQNRLGKRDGETLVAELMPYPSRRANDWPEIYSQRFADRKSYLEGLAPKRIQLLRDILRTPQRELIVCYGKGHWSHYRSIFGLTPEFDSSNKFELITWGSTRVVLTPHFATRAFNSDAQLADFSKIALGR